MEKCPRCMVHTAVCPVKVASSHFLASIWGGAPCYGKLKLPIAFKAVRAFRTLTLARKRCFATFAGVGGGGVGATPLAFPNEAS